MGCCGKFFFYSFLLVVGYVLYVLYKPIEMPKLDPNPYWKTGKRVPDNTQIRPFTFEFTEKALADFKTRLDLPSYLTPSLEKANFTYGIDSEVLKKISTHWRTKYDFKQRQQRINSLSQFKTQIEGLDIHFLHVKPKNVPAGVEVRPLLIVHGWPGSIMEFYRMIPILTTPQKGSKIVFEVIAPSLPGFTFSEASQKPGLGQMQTAQIFLKLMKRLKFEKFYIQGGDWGCLVTNIMATLYPENVLGAHTTMAFLVHPRNSLKHIIGAYLPSGFVIPPEKEDSLYPLTSFFGYLLRETGYFHIQATRPDTVGVGLSESPLGLLAYILEKFSVWTHIDNYNKPDGGLFSNFPIQIDDILDNISLYWFTHSITTSMRYYREFLPYYPTGMDQIPSYVPYGNSDFKYEIGNMPPDFVRAKFPNLVFTRMHNNCGHFPAMECPAVLAADIYDFVSIVEKKDSKTKNEL